MPNPTVLGLSWLLALMIDLAWGEFPNRCHPVVWMGRTISWGERLFLGRGRTIEWAGGLIMTLLIPTVFAGVCYLSIEACAAVPLLQVVVTTLWFKASFALKALGAAADLVRKNLADGDIEAARQQLRSLCSRNASELSEEQLTEAAISSLAENLSDSVLAPWFFAVLFGVPGAIFYRAVNTMDAMIGYQNHYRYLGRVPARTDDLLNLIPARLTVFCLLAAEAFLARVEAAKTSRLAAAWRVALRDHALTPSPNGGWPMATMAGLLGIELRKPGVYSLGQRLRPSTMPLIQEAWRLALLAALLAWPWCMLGSLYLSRLYL